ncbi:MAG: alanine racemase [Pseudomonadota bacterium]
MTHAARAYLNIDALRHNLHRARSAAPRAKILAVVKANGYGHDMVRIAKALQDVDGFGVACLEEAIALRNAGITARILLLQGFTHADELPLLVQHRLESVVHHAQQIALLQAAKGLSPIAVWLKVNTGMNRLGFAAANARHAWRQLNEIAAVQKPLNLLTHFANADVRQDPFTARQLAEFLALFDGFPGARCIANSGGILGWPQSHLDWVRPGIMLYGVSPFGDATGAELGLKPVMTLTANVVAVNDVRNGDSIGYSGIYRAPRDMRVAVIGIGYGDGYPRHATTGTPVLIDGRRAPLVGRVSMDMIMVDVTDLPEVALGATAILWGHGLPIEEIAQHANTIAYELLCKVTRRVQFIETGHG